MAQRWEQHCTLAILACWHVQTDLWTGTVPSIKHVQTVLWTGTVPSIKHVQAVLWTGTVLSTKLHQQHLITLPTCERSAGEQA